MGFDSADMDMCFDTYSNDPPTLIGNEKNTIYLIQNKIRFLKKMIIRIKKNFKGQWAARVLRPKQIGFINLMER